MKIVLTGGGTAGHVMPHIALLENFRSEGWQISYVGGKGIERDIAQKNGVEFFEIQTGKLRRYFSVENFIDIFRILIGFLQACNVLRKLRPGLVFSKGGFVSVPVAYAAWVLRIPVVSHESDLTPGLANKLIEPICSRILCAFPETIRYIGPTKSKVVGIPVRPSLLKGVRSEGLKLCDFRVDEDLPIVLIMGGSSGAERINKLFEIILPQLVQTFRVVHLTGRGKSIEFSNPRYKSFEFLGDGLEHVFAMADAVICRSGANSLFEMKALCKPMLLIPLEIGSRGDQVDNAKSFEAQGWARVVRETGLSPDILLEQISLLMKDAEKLRLALRSSIATSDSGGSVIAALKEVLKEK